MDWRNCLWYKFRACNGLSCCSCPQNNVQPTPEEFNTIYKEFQKWIKTSKEFDKQICKRKRKWNKWVNKKYARRLTTN